MKICFIISTLGPGGAERIITNLTGRLARMGHEVSLVTYSNPKTDSYKLDLLVKRVALGAATHSSFLVEKLFNNIKRILMIRSCLADINPEVVVSFVDVTNVQTLLATMGMSIPVVVCERIDPAYHNIGYIWSALRKLVYRFAKRIVVQTKSACNYFNNHHLDKVIIIPNYVQSPKYYVKTPRDTKKQILAVGRLKPQKGFDILIKAFAQIVRKHTDVTLTILGEGTERQGLECLAADLGIYKYLSMPGIQKDIDNYYSSATLFVLSSRYEGFPNALCEAMAAGLPVIAADCPSGPGELVRHEVDGLLVPPEDIQALADSLDKMLGSPKTMAEMGGRAKEITERYSVNSVMRKWQVMLSEVAGQKQISTGGDR
jgi:GalNAc-alpha-(1->4)-GalNAc-alpha-(1->3)-diNAcBac-PP-undecaprenol alpha-1,4-N-acetyl-D-galactosaminyltransferase